MHRVLREYVIPALVLIGILVAWDLTKPRYVKEAPEPSRAAEGLPNGGVPPWNDNEDINQHNRDSARKTAQRGLDQAWSTFCDPETRAKNLSAISYYLDQRRIQEKLYSERWGKEGHDYIVQQWSTPGDARIERLIEELYGRGYLKLDDFKPYTAEYVAPMVKNAPVAGDPCKN